MTIQKSIDYILGMIYETSLMIAAWAFTSKNPLNAAGNTIQEVKVLIQSWELIYADIID